MAHVDLTGKRFGRWTVVGFSHMRAPGSHDRIWKCVCDCGTERAVQGTNLGRGSTSCGCLQKEVVRYIRRTHDSSDHRLYPTWARMIHRCERPNNRDYKWYGARGISVCERWHDFYLFLTDMGESYKPGLSIDRIDFNGNYEPGNCRWATYKEQQLNTRRTKFIDTPWGRMCITHAANKIGINPGVFRMRVKRGWPWEKLFNPERQQPYAVIDHQISVKA